MWRLRITGIDRWSKSRPDSWLGLQSCSSLLRSAARKEPQKSFLGIFSCELLHWPAQCAEDLVREEHLVLRGLQGFNNQCCSVLLAGYPTGSVGAAAPCLCCFWKDMDDHFQMPGNSPSRQGKSALVPWTSLLLTVVCGVSQTHDGVPVCVSPRLRS